MRCHRKTPGSFGGCSGGNGPGFGPRDARNSVGPPLSGRLSLLRRSGTISTKRTRVLHCSVGYFRFWKSSLLEMSSDTQVAELLDTLSVRFDTLRTSLESYGLQDLPVELLALGLEAMGDERNTEQLCDWLSVGRRRGQPVFPRVRQATAHIRTWLENRPEVQKAVISEALRRWAEIDGSSRGRLNVAQHLHGARPPADFGHWCLEQAVASAQRGECTTARYLLERAVEAVEYRRNDDGLSLEVLEERTRGLKNLAVMLSAMLVCPLDDDYFAHRHEMRSYEEEGRARTAAVARNRSIERICIAWQPGQSLVASQSGEHLLCVRHRRRGRRSGGADRTLSLRRQGSDRGGSRSPSGDASTGMTYPGH